MYNVTSHMRHDKEHTVLSYPVWLEPRNRERVECSWVTGSQQSRAAWDRVYVVVSYVRGHSILLVTGREGLCFLHVALSPNNSEQKAH
jgi:hypothetical protein